MIATYNISLIWPKEYECGEISGKAVAEFHFRLLKNNTIEIGMSRQILISIALWLSMSNETLVWLRPVH